MPVTTISLNGNPVQLVTLPTTPGYRTVTLTASNRVAVVNSIFSGQTQSQRWPGAELWKGSFSLPPLTPAQADVWAAALMQLQGMANAFMLGDPLKSTPRGTPTGAPTVDTSQQMKPGSSTLFSYGWVPNSVKVLAAGDYLQNAYRLYRVLDDINADATGKAAIPIWPSLRETPSGLIVTQNPKGLFRLASNEQSWDFDYTKLSNITLNVQEYR